MELTAPTEWRVCAVYSGKYLPHRRQTRVSFYSMEPPLSFRQRNGCWTVEAPSRRWCTLSFPSCWDRRPPVSSSGLCRGPWMELCNLPLISNRRSVLLVRKKIVLFANSRIYVLDHCEKTANWKQFERNHFFSETFQM